MNIVIFLIFFLSQEVRTIINYSRIKIKDCVFMKAICDTRKFKNPRILGWI